MTTLERQTARFERAFDLDALLHPARVFGHPNDVVTHPALSRDEKRAILASWASDACAVEAAPALRHMPGSPRPIPFDEVMDALRRLDGELQGASGKAFVERGRREAAGSEAIRLRRWLGRPLKPGIAGRDPGRSA